MFDHYVCSLLCAKHYGKWPTKGPEVSKTQRAGREFTIRWYVIAHSSKFLYFKFSIKGCCRKETLLNFCHLLSLIRRKFTITIMTWTIIQTHFITLVIPSSVPSPELFPMEGPLWCQPTPGAASSSPSLRDEISEKPWKAQFIQGTR